MNRITLLRAGAAIGILTLAGSVFALPAVGTERGGGDPAPRAPLLKPATQPAPAPRPAPADTAALLPSGMYSLRLTMNQKTQEQPVKLTRNAGAVTATVDVGETLVGTLDAAGRLQLAGGSAAERLSLAGNVSNRRASGGAQFTSAGITRAGSFTLDPDTAARKPLKEYTPPTTPGAAPCGFWCSFKKMFSLT